VVKAGDTLVKIADSTGVPIEELLSLNPSIDPQGLVTGQRVKLRE
jgi:LysM repeat protein